MKLFRLLLTPFLSKMLRFLSNKKTAKMSNLGKLNLIPWKTDRKKTEVLKTGIKISLYLKRLTQKDEDV